MRKKLGVLCLCLGILSLLSALGFLGYNQWEASKAQRMSQSLLVQVQKSLATEEEKSSAPAETSHTEAGDSTSEPVTEEAVPRMPTIEVKGYDCIGILSIPVLELELPILTDWDYAKLKIAPCLYYGNYYEPNFVLAAHNYTAHFGKLSKLRPGDRIFFTDALGEIRSYEVALLETLPPDATEVMLTSGFDLSLYTCTLDGGSRVTVRCVKVES